jgi:hypothetical protein
MTAPETLKDLFTRKKLTKERTAAKECFERYRENRYQTKVATPAMATDITPRRRPDLPQK